MLKHSNSLLIRYKMSPQLRTIMSDKDKKVVNLSTTIPIPAAKIEQEKSKILSSVAMSKLNDMTKKYNEIIGWDEIEQAYQKVTSLQVRCKV